jgi:hypothetical protein
MNNSNFPVFEPDRPKKFRGIPMNKDASGHSVEIFKQMLLSSGLSPEIANEVKEQIDEASTSDRTNVVFIFTEGTYAVTVVHVPSSAINCERGPVLTRGSTDKHVIAAFSEENIRARLAEVGDGAGFRTVEMESLWVDELEKLAEQVRFELEINPPFNWTTELDLGNLGDN